MTFDDLMRAILAVCPDAEAWESSDGEIQISTGLVATGDGNAPVISWNEEC